MSAWGSSSFRSCDSLLQRIERNDPTMTDLIILPIKTFGDAEIHRLCVVLEKNCQKTHLNSVTASGHAISAAALHRLGHAIACSGSTPLRALAVGDASMGDAGVIALCRGLGVNHPLQTVDLSYKNMTATGFGSVLETVGQSSTLTHLNLSRNPAIGSSPRMITDDDARGTPFFENLVELDLSDCQLTSEFASWFFPLLENNVEQTLLLSNNPLKADGLRALNNCSISTLDVSNCQLGDEGMKVLALFESLPRIVSLDLSKNNISEAGIRSLVSCFTNNNRDTFCLQHLDLSQNPISEQGVCWLVEQGLACQNQSLHSLDLSETACGIKGASIALTGSNVKSLRLFHNQLGSTGFRVLAELIQQDIGCLETLDLAGNKADEDAVVALLTAVLERETRGPSHLKCLVIGGNAAGTKIEELVQQIKQIRPDLDIARDK